MKPEPNYIYTISDKFFAEYPDPSLKFNKDGGRPHYYAFEGKENDQILWMIPMSTKTDKFESIIEKRESQGKPSDIAHVCKVGSKKSAFVIQDMFPITKNYIRDNYKIKGEPLKLVAKKDIEAINQKAKKIHSLIQKGTKFAKHQVDAHGIEKELTEKIKKEEKKRKQEMAKRLKMER
ncbi:hypothetical protein BME96_18935 (plasmid) [Virgibacillus halodenitrificans]|uniref:Uncharacterized protein n=1 Tax=Virgibacillus halodenitrificans TaxID=1482 RepID=A0AAC9J479_VIRHA|nr:hypothetical protein [Virgibacillus halodenitrificans]APC50359.1 hypothetical protein BME96_18935 [Virgibacillus halodenitrificans]AVD54446.1 hypothetical protein CKF96_02745 [Priestia filamentosa]